MEEPEIHMWMNVLEFLLKVLAVGGVVALSLVFGAVVVAVLRRRKTGGPEGELVVTHLNRKYDSLADGIGKVVLGQRAGRRRAKAREKARKQERTVPRRKVYVMDFKGDVAASSVTSLREEITAVLGAAEDGDEAVVLIESGGGLMPSYGLAASQLTRLKKRGIPVTVCVDKIAASGGYMMASVADRIVAAPFAVVGSIGVVAMLPNFHRYLKEHNVDYEELTAGEFKRTVSVFGEITEKGRAKFMEELEDAHGVFKEFVGENRPGLDVNRVATGEHWYGSRALAHNLVDELATSDDYLLGLSGERDIYAVSYAAPRPLHDRITGVLGRWMDRWMGRNGGGVGELLKDPRAEGPSHFPHKL